MTTQSLLNLLSCLEPSYLYCERDLPGKFTSQEGSSTVTFELPGYKPEDVEVAVEGRKLTLNAKRGSKSSINRVYTLADKVDTGKVSAKLEYGVLTITLPYKEAVANSRRLLVLG